MATRHSDLQLATDWIDTTSGKYHFSASADEKSGQWFKYIPYKDNLRAIRWLNDAVVEADILKFLRGLNTDEETVRISPARIRAIRQLAGLMVLGGPK